jgi:alginate O-acetyltransferase complex protein AlgJ
MAGVRPAFITGMAVTAIFIASLWLPTIDNFINIAPSLTGNEKSSLSKLPELKPDRRSIVEFHSKFVKYFIDNFGFRNTFIRWNSLFKLKFLKVDQFPKVLVGKEDWLYLIKDDEGNNALDYFRAIKPFQNDKEIAEWVRPLADIQNYFKRKGIRFMLVFAPMKTRIYPEYVPDYLKPVREITRLDQLMAYLKKNTDIDCIDLGSAVFECKKSRRVYFKHDVHWNSYGSLCAYQEITAGLMKYYPGLRPRSLGDYSIRPEIFHGGDLASMLGLKDQFSEENHLLDPKIRPKARTVPVRYQVKSSRLTGIFETADPSLPRAVVFHDSFFNLVKPFMAEHFSRMACFQSYNRVDVSIIEREKPDLVLYEIVESFIQKSPVYVTPLNFY